VGFDADGWGGTAKLTSREPGGSQRARGPRENERKTLDSGVKCPKGESLGQGGKKHRKKKKMSGEKQT